MVTLIQRNWDHNQGVTGQAVMKFTIQRDGTIVMAQLEKSSGFIVLDQSAQRAVLLTKLARLPDAYPNSSLTLHVTFTYQR